jgi:sec-independent protein translocase protein TatC
MSPAVSRPASSVRRVSSSSALDIVAESHLAVINLFDPAVGPNRWKKAYNDPVAYNERMAEEPEANPVGDDEPAEDSERRTDSETPGSDATGSGDDPASDASDRRDADAAEESSADTETADDAENGPVEPEVEAAVEAEVEASVAPDVGTPDDAGDAAETTAADESADAGAAESDDDREQGAPVGGDPDAVTDDESASTDASLQYAEDGPAATYDAAEIEEAAPDVDTGVFGEGPESDEEMPLTVHIEEMMRRLSVVVLVVVVVMVAVYPVADDLINYLWNAHIPGAATVEGRRPRIYGPLEFLLTKLKVAGLAGFVVGLPVFVYETYLFMRPGLYPNERRYYLAAVPTSLVLALVGITFAHFAVLPAIFAYFTSYTVSSGTVVAFGLRETFNLILLLMGYMAVVFQIPLFIQLAIMMNLTSRRWMEDRRLIFWGSFLGLAFLVSPDPTGMAPIIIAATMIVLFEGTLALLRWTGN